jgi:hypothetical protein
VSYQDPHIRAEIQALIARGNVTLAELNDLRCNSWEWQALVPAMNDEAFVDRMQHTLNNCFTPQARPFSTYDAALEGLWAPELLKRFEKTFTFDQVDRFREAAEISGILFCVGWLERNGFKDLAHRVCEEESSKVREHWREMHRNMETIETILEKEITTVSGATTGSRNATLFRSALRVFAHCAKTEVTPEKWQMAQDELLQAALISGLPEKECRGTLSSAVKAAAEAFS